MKSAQAAEDMKVLGRQNLHTMVDHTVEQPQHSEHSSDDRTQACEELRSTPAGLLDLVAATDESATPTTAHRCYHHIQGRNVEGDLGSGYSSVVLEHIAVDLRKRGTIAHECGWGCAAGAGAEEHALLGGDRKAGGMVWSASSPASDTRRMATIRAGSSSCEPPGANGDSESRGLYAARACASLLDHHCSNCFMGVSSAPGPQCGTLM